MLEQDLQKKIIKYLESLPNSWVVKTITTNKRGTPDIIACIDGRFVAIEVKAKGKMSTLTPIQQFQLNKITEAGGLAFAADSLEKVQNNV